MLTAHAAFDISVCMLKKPPLYFDIWIYGWRKGKYSDAVIGGQTRDSGKRLVQHEDIERNQAHGWTDWRVEIELTRWHTMRLHEIGILQTIWG